MAYAILVVSTVLVGFAADLPLGSLPLALAQDGLHPAAIAAVLGLSSAAALVGSLPLGALVDRYGRLPVLRLAGVAAVVSLALLGVAHGAIPNGVGTALRGLAFTAYVTAEFAYASGLVPPEREVSAVATLGMVGNFTFAIVPALAVALWQHGIGREQYLWGTLAGVAGVALLWLLPARHDVAAVRRSRRIFMRAAWLPAMCFLACATMAGGVNTTLAVLTFHHRGIGNGALLFSALAGTTFALRYPAGRFVDRFGPRIVAIPTALFHVTGALAAARATTVAEVLVAGLLLGVAWSAFVPVGIGLLFERSSARTRGAAMGAYNLSFSIGSTAGALLAAGAAAAFGGYATAIVVAGSAPLVAVFWVIAAGPRRLSERTA